MHGCGSGCAFLVHAEVDSMGGIVDGGVGIGTRTSPRRAAIEKAQAELRLEYDVLEKRRRELEFLEKGGNPLDFKIGHAASVSVQSTSLTDQQHEQFEQFVTSEVKGSFALTASPLGDSVESSGRPGAHPACEPNSADNLMLFDGENEFLEGERNSVHPNRSNIAPSEQSSQFDGSLNARESGESAAFGLPRKAYRRRNRFRPNRDGARSCSTDTVPSRGGLVSSVPSRHCPKDVKVLLPDADNLKDQNISSNCNIKPTSPNGSIVLKIPPPDSPLDMELEGLQAVESTTGPIKGCQPDVSDANASKNLQDNGSNQLPQFEDREICINVASGELVSVGKGEQVVSKGLECLPCTATEKATDQAVAAQMNGFSNANGDTKSTRKKQNISKAFSTKGLDSESSCTQTSLSADGNNDSEMCANLRNIDSNGDAKQPTVASGGTQQKEADELITVKTENKRDDSCALRKDDCHPLCLSQQENGSFLKSPEELNGNCSGLQDEVKYPSTTEGMKLDGHNSSSEIEGKPGHMGSGISTPQNENACTGTLLGSVDSSVQELLGPTLSARDSIVAARNSAVALDQETCSGVSLQLVCREHEDSILKEAQIIEAKRKRIAELSVGALPLENRRKSHWDFVLEEMAWLANDFAQERLWKITAAAKLCHQVAFTSRLRFKEQNSLWKQKKVALTLADAVMEFWHSVEETSKNREKCPEKAFKLAVQGYAARFLKYNGSHVPQAQAEAPGTPDRKSDLGILDFSWDDHLTEENLFFTVPPGAMDMYRRSIESHLLQVEKNGGSMKEEVETSGIDAITDFAYEGDEEETSTYYLPGIEGSNSSKFAQKKQNSLIRSYTAGPCEEGAGLPFVHCMENEVGTQKSVLMGKRPANSLNVSFPTKRVRTASRQRVLGPFSFGASGSVQAPNKTSSGDTSSFQDDQIIQPGGSQIPNSLEVESLGEFEKQLPFDSTEISTKPKKKKKSKPLGLTYEQRWQLDSNFQTEQRDNSKRRLNNQFESNGSSGLFGQHIMKKSKTMRQALDNSLDNLIPMSGSIPSPVASQMSNMSNPNKFIKMLGIRDRGRKAKGLKKLAGLSGSGSPWSTFEEQALVVLVHDMGPNWELVSDAINNTLQFKCIFRKPNECKEHHSFLMDRTAGDGADSAEDSGSSQPYPSTLPGIPKGSAIQLFQHLRGPVVEDTLKSHFEKIIMIGKKQYYRRTQNDAQDPKQLQQPHSSHMLALSQVCPNNLGGSVLTPLDLCDATASSPDVSFGYQGSHTGGLTILNQNTVPPPMLPASSSNSTVQGSSNMVLGSNFSSPSGQLNAPVRDGRYGIPRTASISIDEQQRMQQYNQMVSGRNIQQSGLSVPGVLPGTDRGVRMPPGGSGMGVMCGLNRSVPMARPGFQGIASSSMLNSGSVLSSGMVPMPSPVSMQSGSGSGQGNSVLRPHDALHMMRPGQNPEHQRQMMVPELQMQVSPGSCQAVPPFAGLCSSFSNQPAPPPVQSFPLHHQQSHPMSQQQSHVLSNSHNSSLQGPNHATNTQHQAYAIRIAKERQLQQRLLQQQQQQFAASSALMPHVQTQAQLPISSPLQNSSPIQSQTTPSVSLSPLTPSSSMDSISQQPQKQRTSPHGLGRNPQTSGNAVNSQTEKQRQHHPQQQQFQQTGRHHPQLRQQSHAQQQAKLLKGGVGRGNVMMHQNLPIDPSLLNGLSTTTGSQSAEKGDQIMPFMQGQGLYSGAAANSVQPPKQLMPSHTSNQSQPQQKMFSSQAAPPSRQLQQMPSHTDNSNPGHVSAVTSGPALSGAHQAVPPLVMASSNHQQLQSESQAQQHPQPHQKLVNHAQPTVQRVIQQNHQVNSDPPNKLQAREAQADQYAVNNSSQICSTAMPRASIDAANVVSVISSASIPQWKASEPLYDSGMPAAQLGSVGTPPLTNSSVVEPSPSISQGLGQRQSSGSLSPLGHDIGAQWQQQLSQKQPPSLTLPPQQQQKPSPQQQLPTEHQSQQQTQLLRSGNGSLYVRPTNSRLE